MSWWSDPIDDRNPVDNKPNPATCGEASAPCMLNMQDTCMRRKPPAALDILRRISDETAGKLHAPRHPTCVAIFSSPAPIRPFQSLPGMPDFRA